MSTQKTEYEIAVQDLADIKELRSNEAFNRFYLRRLNKKIADREKAILVERSIMGDNLQGLRNELWALYEMRDLLDSDESICRKMVDSDPE